MYFNQNNNFYHGIMFHHFHDDKVHTKSQGSISEDQFIELINFIGRNNIIDAEEFLDKMKKDKLLNNHVCITFDDGIKSQIDIALPVLENFKIKCFFFVYSSMFMREPDKLEIYRYFRTNYFSSIDEFYEFFFDKIHEDLMRFFMNNKKLIESWTVKFPHYSLGDIKFRLVRDNLLQKEEYDEIMMQMIKEKNFPVDKYQSILFFSKEDIIKLNTLGHTIGLHSHTHPTNIKNFSYDNQELEYKKCKKIISNILTKPQSFIKSMSHPCGSYNKDTLDILKKLEIEIGFKQIMLIEKDKGMKKINNSIFEIARQDHTEIIKRMSL